MNKNYNSWADLPYEKWTQQSATTAAPLPSQLGSTVTKPVPATRCPNCGRRHIRRAKMIYESGTRHGTSNGGSDISFYSSQTDLAASNSPPSEPFGPLFFWACAFVAYVVFVIGAYWLSSTNANQGFFGFVREHALRICILFAITVAVTVNSDGYKRLKLNWAAAKQQWGRDYADWMDKWVCMDCGAQFILR